ncbi:alginate O-acetyltransferase AlgX-related protein [Deinococcus pimensis]|uniref:alginate O-acetyltransferase AlgX-related protein n=1 Tax=Deinococcus pimensis TaxID=309888 RepID=UPI00146FBCEA|nr:hypothetical protein [Deinococcus pimensis]
MNARGTLPRGRAVLALAALSLGGAHAAARGPALCPAVRDPARPGFITSIDDRLFVLPEFDYYVPWTSEDARHLEEFSRLLRRRGLTLVVAPVPYKSDLYVTAANNPLPGRFDPGVAHTRYQALLGALRKVGIAVVDGEEVARDLPAAQEYYTKHDHHWTGEAVEATATRVASLARASGVPLGAPSTVNLRPFREAYGGSIAGELQRTCGITLDPPEQRTFFDVTLDAPEGLLGEARQDVVVVGDSFAYSYFGFPKVLSARLATPVVDASINGGGCCSALTTFFSTRRLGMPEPRLLVWGALNPNFSARATREYKPTIYQAYARPMAVAKGTARIGMSGAARAAVRLASSLSVGSRYFVGMRFEGPKVESFSLDLNSGAGSERVEFWRPSSVTAPRYDTSFFYELAPGARDLRDVSFTGPRGALVTVTLYKYGADAF